MTQNIQNGLGKGSRYTLQALTPIPPHRYSPKPLERTTVPYPSTQTQRLSRTAFASVGLVHAAHVNVCAASSAQCVRKRPSLPYSSAGRTAQEKDPSPLNLSHSLDQGWHLRPGTKQGPSEHTFPKVALAQVVNWGQRWSRGEETLMLCPAGALLCSDGGWCVDSYIHPSILSLHVWGH
jgi:hypothetical protein